MKKNESVLELPNSEDMFSANIFYRLLLGSMKHRYVPGDNFKENISLTQTHLFYDLNALINSPNAVLGDYSMLLNKGRLQGTQKNAANNFKYGTLKVENSNVYSFNNKTIVNDFNFKVEHSYNDVLENATEFVSIYFETDNSVTEKLIKEILFLIISDESIDESQKFYICSDGSTKTKSELRNIDNIEFDAFLLGVWHYLIVSQRLQVGLKGIEDIAVDIAYKQLKTSITYSHIKQGSYKKINNKTQISKKRSNSYRNDCFDFEMQEYVPELEETLAEIEVNICRDTNIIGNLKNNDIVLSRSIFFHILCNNIETAHWKLHKNVNEKLFLCLMELTTNNCFSKNFDDSCSYDFLDLKEKYSVNFLDDKKCITDFAKRICNNYEDILSDMIYIGRKFFRSKYYNECLVVTLIEFIKNDKTIDDSFEFYVCSDGSTLTKSQLCEIEEIEFEPFLIGIWYYVASQLNAKDCNDEKTFDTVFKYNFKYRDEEYIRYFPTQLIEQQSDMYVELIYMYMDE